MMIHNVNHIPAGKHLLKVSSSNIRTTLESVVLMLLLLTLSMGLTIGIAMLTGQWKVNTMYRGPSNPRYFQKIYYSNQNKV